ncbi:MAG TPA: beta-ketoacyl-ACP synthase [Anaeromyxobacteraceae bacterium]|nr:beta-ketoacyl-ACP synthase [Anaeromyxobacteraceae bacterium]
MDRRVVITGVGIASPIGNDLDAVSRALREDRTGVRSFPEWADVKGLRTRLGAPVDVDLSSLPRKRTRTMGRVALLATWATQKALDDAGVESEVVSSGRVGVAYGSTSGSPAAIQEFVGALQGSRSLQGIQSATYLRFMSHTCAANIAQYFAVRGRIIPTCSACVSSSQAIGYAYEAIRNGAVDAMIAGGAEELGVAAAAIFDILFATSADYNDRPAETPRPFDAARDGLVVGEGAGTLILESLEMARARNARIYGEVLGFGTNCDGYHMTAPSEDGMARVIELALADARLGPDRVDYVNAHATGTDVGDATESRAMLRVLGRDVPVSSTKGFTGHTLGGCGVIESVFCLTMLRDHFLAPSRNLREVAPDCARLDYVMGAPRDAHPKVIMNNNFAFAGINTSLLFGTF